ELGRWRNHIFQGVAAAIEKDLFLREGYVLKTQWLDLRPAVKHAVLYGAGGRHITFTWRHAGGQWKHGGKFQGVVNDLLDDYRKSKNPMRRRQLERYMEFVVCAGCGGMRLNRQAQNVLITSNS